MPLVVVIGWVEHDEPGRLALPMFSLSWPDPVESMEPFWVAATTGRTLATAEICHLAHAIVNIRLQARPSPISPVSARTSHWAVLA